MAPVHQHQHFGEKSEAVFTSIDSSVTAKDVESMLILPSTPCLISSGDGSFMISVDKKIINEEIQTFEAGFFMMFAVYYTLNIEYSEMACVTLEFIQRCFLNMNPDKPSKASKRKKSAMNQKVLTLL
ncbi:unnamed protein product [Larinioides sclopetarius]|uniref:Uncharacterized protein n=1 Tax=Larinioides sclopetarius TaxID=280406 RepID=A0AAV1ZX25_9ARAC